MALASLGIFGSIGGGASALEEQNVDCRSCETAVAMVGYEHDLEVVKSSRYRSFSSTELGNTEFWLYVLVDHGNF